MLSDDSTPMQRIEREWKSFNGHGDGVKNARDSVVQNPMNGSNLPGLRRKNGRARGAWGHDDDNRSEESISPRSCYSNESKHVIDRNEEKESDPDRLDTYRGHDLDEEKERDPEMDEEKESDFELDLAIGMLHCDETEEKEE